MAKKMPFSVHVMPSDDNWVVKLSDEKKINAMYRTRRDAEKAAKKLAQNASGQLVVHMKDGRIQSRNSFCAISGQTRKAREVLYPVQRRAASQNKIKIVISDIMNETKGTK
ncbi:MAG: DUF2188 domain-containing protein [Anaerolineaceae bacterium]|nr:DUF2188 domain-containing protein [Anaerolineaceae bacterium]